MASFLKYFLSPSNRVVFVARFSSKSTSRRRSGRYGASLVPLNYASQLAQSTGFSTSSSSSSSFSSSSPSSSSVRRIDPTDPNFLSLFTPSFRDLLAVFRRHGHELRVAGGAVRDIVSGRRPHDVDFATTATPVEMMAMFEAEGIRVVHNRGAAHGTIMVRVNDEQNFEVTTSRINVVTLDADVKRQFTRDWFLDACQRDLTVNAMFLTLDGDLVDYHDGERHLREGRVVFVGDAGKRIQEDYLRILRYFRFHALLAADPKYHDPETLEAISRHRKGLDELSGERIWTELKRVFSGRYACHSLRAMHRVGVLPHCGLPSSIADETVECVAADLEAVADLAPHPVAALSGLFQNRNSVVDAVARMKHVSKAEQALLLFLLKNRSKWRDPGIKSKTFKDVVVDGMYDDEHILKHVLELVKLRNERGILEELKYWKPPQMPVTMYDLWVGGFKGGKHARRTLKLLHELWKNNDFELEKEELLRILENTELGQKRDQSR